MNTLWRRAALAAAVALLTACGGGGETPEKLLASARDYLAKNDGRAAIIQIKSALQKDPNSAEARYLLGKTLLETGDAVAAEVELRKALDLKHPDAQVLPVLARTWIVLGQPKKLTDAYAGTNLPEAAAEADLQTSLATAWGMQGKTADAERALAAALKANPEHAPALRFQARLKADARDFDGAFALLDRALAKNPKDHEAWHLKGELTAFAKQDPAAAMDAYRKALAAKPNYVPSHQRLIMTQLGRNEIAGAKESLAALKKVLPNQPQTIYLEALTLTAEKNFTAAREKAQALLKLTPNNLSALQLGGSIELQLGSLVQAEAMLNRVLAAAPGQVATRRQLAQIALRNGQTPKALDLLKPLLERPTAEAVDFNLAAQAHLLAGDAKKAEEAFSRAAKIDPKDVRSRTALALAKMQTDGASEALADLESLSASDSGTMADMALVAAHLRRREYDKALKALDAIEKKQPGRPATSVMRARVHLLRNDVAAARSSFEQALKLDGKHFPAIAGLAALDFADKKPDEARKRFEELLTADPKNMRAMIALATLRARSGGSKEEVATLLSNAVKANPGEPSPRLLLVNHHIANKDFKLALAAAQEGVAALPNNADLLDALGRAQALAGDKEQATASFNRLASLRPQSPVAHMRLAELHANAKDFDAAAQSLKKALGVSPNYLQAQRALVAVELAAKRPAEAVAVARQVQKQRPAEPVGYLLEADIETGRKNWGGAETALRTGLKQAPKASELAIRLHGVLIAGDKKAEADKLQAAWLRDQPNDARFVMYLGDRALAENKPADAEARYRAVLKIQPNNGLAMNNVAWLMASQKKPGALPLAQKAAELLPNQPAVLDTLALAQAEEGQMPQALETMKKALALQPGNPGLQLNLAKLYIRAGDKAAAKTELEALAKLGDKFAGQKAVAELMKTL